MRGGRPARDRRGHRRQRSRGGQPSGGRLASFFRSQWNKTAASARSAVYSWRPIVRREFDRWRRATPCRDARSSGCRQFVVPAGHECRDRPRAMGWKRNPRSARFGQPFPAGLFRGLRRNRRDDRLLARGPAPGSARAAPEFLRRFPMDRGGAFSSATASPAPPVDGSVLGNSGRSRRSHRRIGRMESTAKTLPASTSPRRHGGVRLASGRVATRGRRAPP